MKNIHVLPTDNKPSRLYFNINDKEFQIYENEKTSTVLKPNRQIYITNDEEIKEGDCCLSKLNEIIKFHGGYDYRYYAKIILTTDQDLIKNGVQAIDDEFLEWFVNNPSCEWVKTELLDVSETLWEDYFKKYGVYPTYPYYEKIIIPQEEPKQETFEKELITDDSEITPDYFQPKSQIESIFEILDKKQETLEEAAEMYIQSKNPQWTPYHKQSFKEGVKWQQERMYSEEEVYKLLLKHQSSYRSTVRNTSPLDWSFDIKQWFEQFKKK